MNEEKKESYISWVTAITVFALLVILPKPYDYWVMFGFLSLVLVGKALSLRDISGSSIKAKDLYRAFRHVETTKKHPVFEQVFFIAELGFIAILVFSAEFIILTVFIMIIAVERSYAQRAWFLYGCSTAVIEKETA